MGKRTRKGKKIEEDNSSIKKSSPHKKKSQKTYSPKKIDSQKESPSKKTSIILISLFLVFTILLSCCSFYLCIKIYERERKSLQLEESYSLLKKELIEKKNEIKALSNEIDSYQLLDEKIDSTRNLYFSEIKKVEDDILSGTSNRKIAYITFDDGPYYNTYNVFNILDQYGVKATFFTTNINGEYCYDNEDANCWIRYREYVERGHTIANHTYTHGIFRGLYNSADSFMDAVIRQEELIREQTGGYITNIVRFPGGSGTAKSLKQPIIERLRERGYGWVDWTANDGDGGNLFSNNRAWELFTNSINNSIEVILFHDYSSVTTNMLPQMIEYLQNNGYECYPLFYESNMIQK